MITGPMAIVYADDAVKARQFFKDVLDLPYIDAHDGWLVFKLPPADLGVRACEESGSDLPSGQHELYLLCEDIVSTVAELEAKGVEFTAPISPLGAGMHARFCVPGAGLMGLYQPRRSATVGAGA